MNRLLSILMLATALLFSPGAAYAADNAPPPIEPDDLMPYLQQAIAWRQAIDHTEQMPDNSREVLLKNRLRSVAQEALRQSFAFARAQMAVFDGEDKAAGKTPAPADERHARLNKAADDVAQRIDDLQDKLTASHLSAADRETYNGQLKLAKAQQDLLQTMQHIFRSGSSESGNLRDQIEALALQSLDDTPDQLAASKPAEGAAAAQQAQDKETILANEGMLKLSSSLFSLARKRDQINALMTQTSALLDKNHQLVLSIRTALRAALAQGTALSANHAGSAKDIADYHKGIDALVAHYKQLSATVVPLGTMNVLLEGAGHNLREWEGLIEGDWNQVLRQLMIRIAVLSIGLAIPLILSALAHRAIVHVQDHRRRRQLRIARRVVLFIVLTFVILANFMTEFGSLATFAGFITAGLAVALQTVLVSLVAHFFFFGRYGVRAGDRITVNGVTGDVVQIGMLRLYMHELKETDQDFIPTGKLVAFPNSILFQPSAFYKYMDQAES